MNSYLIAHEGQLPDTCIVHADNGLEAVVKYYEVARVCGNEIGTKGHKRYLISDVTECDCTGSQKWETIMHHADIDGTQWLGDVYPIDQWAKYGHHHLTRS